MTLGDAFEQGKNFLIGVLVLVIAVPLFLYVITPSVYYVEEDAQVRLHIKSVGEVHELRCPRFNVGSEQITLSGHYAGRPAVVRGSFEYVLMRGVHTVGPVTFEVAGSGDEAGAVVTLESRDHPIVPRAYIHDARSVVTQTFTRGDRRWEIEVRWAGTVDSPNPPIESVTCNGKPVSRRITNLGAI